MNKFFYIVDIAVPLRQTFTYHSNQEIIPGTRVAVKFGKTNKLGVVTETVTNSDIQTKLIHMVLDDGPVFSKTDLKTNLPILPNPLIPTLTISFIHI